MTDFGVYWPFFSKKDEPWPVNGWRIGAGSRLADLEARDRLWLFTSGTKCKKKLGGDGFASDVVGENAAFLAQILTVKNIEPNREGGFDLLVNADIQRSPKVFPPLLVDHLVRPEGADATVPIGRFRQAAWRLRENTVDLLKELLRLQRIEAFAAVEW
jgi:hypothetical protein